MQVSQDTHYQFVFSFHVNCQIARILNKRFTFIDR